MTLAKSQNTKATYALVTGAAGGIGQHLTSNLIAAGHHVLMLDINQAGLDNCKARFGDQVTTISCDVTDPGSVLAAAESVKQAAPSLDVIVNNAGFIIPGPFMEATSAAIEKQMQINLMGPLRVLSTFLPLVNKGGSVVNIVSMAGIMPLKDSAVYTAGKFGLRGLTLTLNMELRPRGIRVSGIYPSSVDTPMLRYEAQNGGSPLNFIAEPLLPEKVAALAMRALREGKMEYYIPMSDSILSRIAASIPWVLPWLLPMFEKKGQAGKEKFLAKIRAESSQNN